MWKRDKRQRYIADVIKKTADKDGLQDEFEV